MPFNNIASGFYVETWFKNIPKQEAIKKAGIAMGFPFFVSIILVPVFSLFVVKNDKKEYILFVSTIFSLLAFSMFYFFTPIYSIILLGLSYSLFASVIWPTISLVVANNVVVMYCFYSRDSLTGSLPQYKIWFWLFSQLLWHLFSLK